ncbi:MAG: Mg2+ and Co2+ transporter CorB [Deltaproteobacteria bacterium]|nr:Mg2+ and Co2+ transporter CorB [Deltaproteobacteria bacterium]|tara:strand:- start:72 stop:1118 length:1047 start_codon:yes stop_codon:yes gene_type:complete
MELALFIGIFFCLTQSAIFSGLTLGLFGLSRLKLEIEVESGNKAALKVLELRKDANLLLTTLLWGNVSINVLLTLLTDSVLAGLWAFFLSSICITLFGEILPQAYFSRNALRMGIILSPVIRFYRFFLYPVSKPSAILLDKWLGKEGVLYFKEEDFRIMLQKHMESRESDISQIEGTGALNFLSIDDLPVGEEGEVVDPASIISLETEFDLPVFPIFQRSPEDPFLNQVQNSGKKWVILTSIEGTPRLVLNADLFLRDALFGVEPFRPYSYCHRPIVVSDSKTPLGEVINKLRVHPEHSEDDVIDNDLILCWNNEKRIITGADLLGRLLRGIAGRRPQFLIPKDKLNQ